MVHNLNIMVARNPVQLYTLRGQRRKRLKGAYLTDVPTMEDSRAPFA
jgi:hypothetical protein